MCARERELGMKLRVKHRHGCGFLLSFLVEIHCVLVPFTFAGLPDVTNGPT